MADIPTEADSLYESDEHVMKKEGNYVRIIIVVILLSFCAGAVAGVLL
ncbi:MAG: hypothetical protein KIS94_12425 [Chitinophagales bacterium]|nr:hypothetical protein [Chitinophagales bacterium]